MASYLFDDLEERKASKLRSAIASVLIKKYGAFHTSSVEKDRYEWRWLTSDIETIITLTEKPYQNSRGECDIEVMYSDRKHIEEGKKKHEVKKRVELEQKKRAAKRMYETSAANF
jgi:hypothetical protein